MSKTTAKTAGTVEFPAFDAGKATDQFRVFTEKGVEQSKEAYEQMRSNAETAQKALETTFETARTASNEVSLKAISAMRANAEAGFSHLEALLGAKSISEVIELQTSFVRKGVEMTVDQTRELQSVSARAVEEASKPMKNAFEKSFKELKVA